MGHFVGLFNIILIIRVLPKKKKYHNGKSFIITIMLNSLDKGEVNYLLFFLLQSEWQPFYKKMAEGF